MINFATKLIAGIIQSYVNEMLLTVYEYDVVDSLKILRKKQQDRTLKLQLGNRE